MTPDETRAALRRAEAELADVRVEMDHYVAVNASMPAEVARGFAARLEAANSRIWALRAKLRPRHPVAG